MNLYRISQSKTYKYDTFDSAIVCAGSEEEARNMNPGGNWGGYCSTWCRSPDQVKVELIGYAIEGATAGIELSSFNAG
jgi:hypothetical protein